MITFGGCGMKAIAAPFRYIGFLGKKEVCGKRKTLEIEDERGKKIQGRYGLVQLTDGSRVVGAYINDDSPRREAEGVRPSTASSRCRPARRPRR